MRSPIMSWQGPSAPRVEGIATKSLVVVSCASKLRRRHQGSFAWYRSRSWRRCSHCCFQNRNHANTLHGQISRPMETRMPINRNILYLVVGALIVAVGVLGYNLYQTKKEPEGLQINLGPNGLKIQNK